jgi:hypothetical protein
MAAYNKHNDFVEQLGLAKHNLNTDTQKVLLTNTAPTAANSIRGDLTELGGGNGYTSGGEDIQNTYAESGGTGTLTGTKVVWTASGGTIGPFRYVDLYNDTQTSPVDPLIAWWDYGSSITLQNGETFSWKPNNSETTGTVFTIA